ncbi:ABC transporter permease [Sulfurimonas sp. CVO]|jgi:putative ABC transport system permease protein|uniref:ABC transporter permease n=1 Tax=Sulfurimonas xiamenensis TaxID=2590021 RepID=A0AAJ4A498_9BACT|nr:MULTISPECIES: FtsX-like permease family protein [Sulfurimonas]PLY15447.1 MAG: ABC transporter substrate-binding protein [Sulfurimonas sp.]QFR43513.1 ABC transporter permease [Sulfurimonas xiamenensis]QHG90922.1 ABC transporter permease [Sulfurimonas sp. CVO]
MKNIIKISFRNLTRSSRRTILTASLITIGVIFVLVYAALSGSFKSYMVAQITDSMMGHIQIHKKGYVESIDNLPLDKNLNKKQLEQITKLLDENPYVQDYTFRLKLGAMFSNYISSTSIRLNAIEPKRETSTLPLFTSRVTGEDPANLKESSLIVPDILAKGMDVKVGDTVVLVATNEKGSVNGLNFRVSATLESISGPGGRDGYIHINDAKKLLRIGEMQISEIVIRLKNVDNLQKALKLLEPLKLIKNQKDKPVFEIHSWEKLSPFYNIVKMLDIMDISIKIILISIVLISILNVMVMSVYERIKEIGTIAAMGTTPSTITKLFLAEGLMLGIFGTTIGAVFSYIIIFIINGIGITFSFGRQDGLLLTPTLEIGEVALVSLIVIIISLIASISPARKAAKLNPVDALRQN